MNSFSQVTPKAPADHLVLLGLVDNVAVMVLKLDMLGLLRKLQPWLAGLGGRITQIS